MRENGEFLTPGQLARAVGISPRKACTLFDEGAVQGFRLTKGTKRTERRIYRASAAAYLRSIGHEVGALKLEGKGYALLVGAPPEAREAAAGNSLVLCASGFLDAGAMCERYRPWVVVVWASLGVARCREEIVTLTPASVWRVVVPNEDGTGAKLVGDGLFDRACVGPREVLEEIQRGRR